MKIDNLLEKYLGPFPNTYVFAKNLSEQIIKDECSNIKTVIFRPSIVIATAEEPIAGWIDNFLGPVGLITGIAKGIIRCVISRHDIRPDYMPVDIATKGMIVAAWRQALTKDDESNLIVYNASSGYKSITSKELMQMGFTFWDKYPFLESFWIPTIMYTTNKTWFYVNVMIQQVLPAFIIDSYMKFKKKKFIELMRLQRKVYLASLALSYFTSKTWMFLNKNFSSLLYVVSDKDKDRFWCDFEYIDPIDYMEKSFLGGHKYLMNTDFSTMPAAIKRYKRLTIMHNIAKAAFWIFVVSYVFGKVTSYLEYYQL